MYATLRRAVVLGDKTTPEMRKVVAEALQTPGSSVA